MSNQDNTLKYYNDYQEQYVEQTLSADMDAPRSHFLSYVPSGGKIMDLGCGSGRDSKAFIEQGYNLTAIDGSDTMCKQASKLLGQVVLHRTFQEIDYFDEFDGIWACASLLHVAEQEISDVLLKISTSLKSGGVLYASWKYGDSERIEANTGRFFCDMTEERIHKYLQQGANFRILEIWISKDVRNHDQTWINVIATKPDSENSGVVKETIL